MQTEDTPSPHPSCLISLSTGVCEQEMYQFGPIELELLASPSSLIRAWGADSDHCHTTFEIPAILPTQTSVALDPLVVPQGSAPSSLNSKNIHTYLPARRRLQIHREREVDGWIEFLPDAILSHGGIEFRKN